MIWTPFASAFTPERQMDQADITMTILRQLGEVETVSDCRTGGTGIDLALPDSRASPKVGILVRR